MRDVIERGKRLGLISAPGDKASRKIQLSGEVAQHNGVRLQFCTVTPDLARQWLHNNTGNRKLKEDTVEAYARDMRNGDWLTTHQGIAFNDEEQLIDGQHRLEAIVRSGVSVVMLVSHGWPAKAKDKKVRTMDAVDRGAARSLSDLLKLQHNIENGRLITATATVIAQIACPNPNAVRKMSMPTLLAILDLYRDDIRFAVENAPTTIGLRQNAVLGAMAFLHAVHPKRSPEVYERLKTGENLSRDNPLLPLRNYLMSDAAKKNNKSERLFVVQVIAHHAMMFLNGEPYAHAQEKVTHTKVALAKLKDQQIERAARVAKLFAITPPPGEVMSFSE